MLADVNVSAGVSIDRAILLGGQALGEAFADSGMAGGHPMSWNEEWTDHNNALEVSGKIVGGKRKFPIRWIGW